MPLVNPEQTHTQQRQKTLHSSAARIPTPTPRSLHAGELPTGCFQELQKGTGKGSKGLLPGTKVSPWKQWPKYTPQKNSICRIQYLQVTKRLVTVTRQGISFNLKYPKPKTISRNYNSCSCWGAQSRAGAPQTQLLLGSSWFSPEITKSLFHTEDKQLPSGSSCSEGYRRQGGGLKASNRVWENPRLLLPQWGQKS